MKYNTASDRELIECCQKDDIRAYNELFDRYVNKLYRAGLRYLKDETIVEELVMDILLNLWDRRKEIQLKGNLSSYLFRAVHNKAISQLRKPIPFMVDIQTLNEDTFADHNSADDGILLKDTEKHYEKLLRQLSPQRQTAFRLSREEGLSYADIATAMNLSPNTVKNHINAALDYLRHKVTLITILVGFTVSLFY